MIVKADRSHHTTCLAILQSTVKIAVIPVDTVINEGILHLTTQSLIESEQRKVRQLKKENDPTLWMIVQADRSHLITNLADHRTKVNIVTIPAGTVATETSLHLTAASLIGNEQRKVQQLKTEGDPHLWMIVRTDRSLPINNLVDLPTIAATEITTMSKSLGPLDPDRERPPLIAMTCRARTFLLESGPFRSMKVAVIVGGHIMELRETA